MRRNTVNRGLVSPRNRKERKIKSGVERKAETPTPPTYREESGTRSQTSEHGYATCPA
jgi:hypothetical protein